MIFWAVHMLAVTQQLICDKNYHSFNHTSFCYSRTRGFILIISYILYIIYFSVCDPVMGDNGKLVCKNYSPRCFFKFYSYMQAQGLTWLNSLILASVHKKHWKTHELRISSWFGYAHPWEALDSSDKAVWAAVNGLMPDHNREFYSPQQLNLWSTITGLWENIYTNFNVQKDDLDCKLLNYAAAIALICLDLYSWLVLVLFNVLLLCKIILFFTH